MLHIIQIKNEETSVKCFCTAGLLFFFFGYKFLLLSSFPKLGNLPVDSTRKRATFSFYEFCGFFFSLLPIGHKKFGASLLLLL